jgi:hypothetical protein
MEPDVDPPQRSTLAANGLSDDVFGLPPPQRKGLKAITSNDIDSSQMTRLLQFLATDPSMDAAAKHACGADSARALGKDLEALKDDQARVGAITAKCHATVDRTGAQSEPWALLTSVLLADELSSSGGGEEELKLAALVAGLRSH